MTLFKSPSGQWWRQMEEGYACLIRLPRIGRCMSHRNRACSQESLRLSDNPGRWGCRPLLGAGPDWLYRSLCRKGFCLRFPSESTDFTIYVNQTIVPYTLNSDVCQLFLKTGKHFEKGQGRAGGLVLQELRKNKRLVKPPPSPFEICT